MYCIKYVFLDYILHFHLLIFPLTRQLMLPSIAIHLQIAPFLEDVGSPGIMLLAKLFL